MFKCVQKCSNLFKTCSYVFKRVQKLFKLVKTCLKLIRIKNYITQNAKYIIQNIKYSIRNTKYKIQNTKYKYNIQNTKYKIQNTKYKIQNTRNDYILLPLCHQCQADSHQAIKRRALCHQLTDFQQSYIQLEVGKPGSSYVGSRKSWTGMLDRMALISMDLYDNAW